MDKSRFALFLVTESLPLKKQGELLPTAISGKDRRHYCCKHGSHEWDKTHYVE